MNTDNINNIDETENFAAHHESVTNVFNKISDDIQQNKKEHLHRIIQAFELKNNKGIHLETTLINDIRYLNKHFIKVNHELLFNSYYIGFVETLEDWREQRKARRIPYLGKIVIIWDFFFLRLLPKVWGLKKLYFLFTRGKGRLISKAEVLGRLISCGFEIEDIKKGDGKHYFLVKKIEQPKTIKPSYGPLFKMKRVGKGGKIIGVYKFRTMHPYSEFLQDYMIKTQGYGENGKIQDDFRTSRWARLIRRYWIDELPQLINVLKGEMKLVGVRPVSPVYFNDIPEDLQQMRLKFKPGCIPPYVAFNQKSSVKSVLESERRYLEMKINNPYTTDIKLFFQALYNIIIRGKRSA